LISERHYWKSATIENTATKERRKEVVEPLTNYNVLVLDQRFRQTHLYHLSTQTQPEMGALETLTFLLYYLT
jgi:hypothetical protein